jgi:helicase
MAVDYLHREFGDEWVGTRSLAAGAVLHHGDIPQETREVLEEALRRNYSQFAICTSTLAEGSTFRSEHWCSTLSGED